MDNRVKDIVALRERLVEAYRNMNEALKALRMANENYNSNDIYAIIRGVVDCEDRTNKVYKSTYDISEELNAPIACEGE